MRQYIGLIHKDAASDYGVSFPDFPFPSRLVLTRSWPILRTVMV
jgi:hypothetical protein